MPMNSATLIKIGIVAKLVYGDIAPDIKIVFVRDVNTPYIATKDGHEEEVYLRLWRDVTGFEVGLGYSERCNVLAVWLKLEGRG